MNQRRQLNVFINQRDFFEVNNYIETIVLFVEEFPQDWNLKHTRVEITRSR